METLINIDEALFHFINGTLHNGVFDIVFSLIRERWLWLPIYLFGAFFTITNYKRDGWIIIVVLIGLIIVSDQSTSTLMKPMIMRYRPCQIMSLKTRLLVDCGAGFSMPSSHASNHFGIAFFVGLVFYRKTKILLPALSLWALLICIAQVYVGVHFPFDVLMGGIWGAILGTIAYFVCKRFLSRKFYAAPLPAPPRRRRRTHRLIFENPSPEDEE